MSGSAGKRNSDATNNDSPPLALDSAAKKQKTTPPVDMATNDGSQPPQTPAPPGTVPPVPANTSANNPPTGPAPTDLNPPPQANPPAGPGVSPPVGQSSIFRCPAHSPLPTAKATLCITLDSVVACAQASGQLASSLSQTAKKTLRSVLQGPIDKLCSTLKPLTSVDKTQCTEYAHAVAILSAQDATANALASAKGKKGQKEVPAQTGGGDQGASSQGEGETSSQGSLAGGQMISAAHARVPRPGAPLTICACADAPGLWTVWGDLLRGSAAPSFSSNYLEQTLSKLETDFHNLKRAQEREAKDEKSIRELMESSLRLATSTQATQKVLIERMAKTEEGLQTMGKELQQCNTQIGQSLAHRDAQIGVAHEVQQAELQRARAEAERGRAETERGRVETERGRKDLLRDSNESQRATSEQARAQAESWRVTKERERDEMEGARGHDEEDRVTAENARVQAERLRAEGEHQRTREETSRQSAEGSRVSAEARRDTDCRNQLASLAQSRQSNLQAPPPPLQAPQIARSQPPGLAHHVASAVSRPPYRHGQTTPLPQQQQSAPPPTSQRGPLLATPPTRQPIQPIQLFNKPTPQQYDIHTQAAEECCLHVSMVPRGTPFPDSDGEILQVLKAHGCAPHFPHMAHIHRVKPSQTPTQILKIYLTSPAALDACKVEGNRAASSLPPGADRLFFDTWNPNPVRGNAATLVGERAQAAERVTERALSLDEVMKLPSDHPIRAALEKNLQDISGHSATSGRNVRASQPSDYRGAISGHYR